MALHTPSSSKVFSRVSARENTGHVINKNMMMMMLYNHNDYANRLFGFYAYHSF